jgi:hypothetical protein
MIVGQLETAAEAGGADQAGSAEERAGSIAVVMPSTMAYPVSRTPCWKG